MSKLLAFCLATMLWLLAACDGGGEQAPTPGASPAASPSATEQAAIVGAWSLGAPMPTARSEITSAVLDGKIYVVGGFEASGGNSDVVEAYDPYADAWQRVAPLPVRLDHAMAASDGGTLYVMGGYRVFGAEISSATYEYDPQADAWTERAPLPLPRAAGAAVAVDGVIYIVGGVGPEPTVPLAYDVAADAWRELREFASSTASREHLTAQAVDGRIYVIGGRWQGVNVDTVEVYDPASDSWQTLAPMPTARGGLASAVIGGRIHVVGGEDLAARTTFAEHEVYDPSVDGWTAALPLPTARHGLTAQPIQHVDAGGPATTILVDVMYVIGGGPQAALSTSALVEIFTPGE